MSETDLKGMSDTLQLPRDVYVFVQNLAARHGGGILRNESNGLHLYIACPECLKNFGTKELQSKHLAINIDKCYGLNKFATYQKSRVSTEKGVKNELVALCHKTNKGFSVKQLMNMQKIEDRPEHIKAMHKEVTMAASKAVLLKDERGNYIPYPPGKITPLIELQENHPALEYLRSRDYDIQSLWEQLGASYCYEETPGDTSSTPDEQKIGVYYRRMPDGWKDTPQGRIIFFADIRNTRKGWQARLLEKKVDGWKWYYHPYREEWVAVEKEIAPGQWEVREDYRDEKYQWKPSKYRMATGTDMSKGVGRSSILMGFDAAVKWNEERKTKIPFAVLVEGPLDAGRIGAPALAMLGKYLSDQQAALLRVFKKIIVVLDNDDAGQSGLVRVKNLFAEKHMDFDVCVVPKPFKDVGEMTTIAAWEMLEPVIKDCL